MTIKVNYPNKKIEQLKRIEGSIKKKIQLLGAHASLGSK